MASSGNFGIWNRLANVNPSLSYSGYVLDKGNIRFRGDTGGTSTISSTLSMPSGKWYIEVYAENNPAGGWPCLGILKTESIPILQNVSNYQNYTSGTASDRSVVQGTDGQIYKFGATSAASGGSSWSDGDVLQIAVDVDNGKWYFGKNNTYSNSSVPADGTNPIDTFTAETPMVVWVASYNGSSYMYINAGQDSTFSGNITAGGNADGNGFGDFKYSPPTGFLALCSANLPLAEELDPAEEKQPAKYFDAVAYTGNGSTQNITGLGFQPDVTLIKNRGETDSWCHQNSTLGVGKTQAIDTDAAVASETDCVTAFNSNGFSLGNNHKVNASSENYIAYCWKKSVDAGLDIVTYTGDGSTQAVSHNLGVTPTMIWIFLNTGSNFDSVCYIDSNNAPSMGTGNGIFLSLPNAKQASTYVSATSSSSFSVTTSANSSGRTYFAYVWAEKPGFSKFIEYEGNGNNDGPFIYNNFLGKLNIIKAIDSSQMWATTDIVRETFNPLGEKIIALDATYAEFDASGFNYDMVSNGIKIRSSDTNINSSASFLSLSWASVPFKYNNTF